MLRLWLAAAGGMMWLTACSVTEITASPVRTMSMQIPVATITGTKADLPTKPAVTSVPVTRRSSPAAYSDRTPTASPTTAVAIAEQRIIYLINVERLEAGVSKLRADAVLMEIARERAADMATRGYLGHYDPVTDEHLARKMMRARGYNSNYLGENWYGGATPPPAIADEAMRWFMSDAPHAQNILSPHYTSVGTGLAFNGELWVVVQVFAGE